MVREAALPSKRWRPSRASSHPCGRSSGGRGTRGEHRAGIGGAGRGARGPRPDGRATATVLRWELRKLVSQKRTYLGLGLAALFPLIFVVFENLHQRHGRGGNLSVFARQITLVGPGDAGADAGVPVGLHAAADRVARRRRHRGRRGRQRHAEDDPHALGRPRPGVRGEGAGGDALRGARGTDLGDSSQPSAGSRRGAFIRCVTLSGTTRLGARSAAAGVRVERDVPDPAAGGGRRSDCCSRRRRATARRRWSARSAS